MTASLTAEEIAELRENASSNLERDAPGQWAEVLRLLDEVEGWRNPEHIRIWRDKNAADLEAARALLKRIEWEGDCERAFGGVCPCCAAYESDGHKSDCELAALLR